MITNTIAFKQQTIYNDKTSSSRGLKGYSTHSNNRQIYIQITIRKKNTTKHIPKRYKNSVQKIRAINRQKSAISVNYIAYSNIQNNRRTTDKSTDEQQANIYTETRTTKESQTC